MGAEDPRGNRILLIEDLDALGADVEDARRRAARLQANGSEVIWIAVAPKGASGSRDPGSSEDRLLSRDSAGPTLRQLATDDWDRVVLASAFPGGGPLTRWLPDRVQWWPTGFAAGRVPDWMSFAPWALGHRRLEPLDGTSAWGASWLFGWSEVDALASRRPGLPLWDGDLVLSLSGLTGPHGRETIAAFATVAETWNGVDLVGWSQPTAELQSRARAAGVEMRIHHVGPAPRLAESSWLAQASIGMLDGGCRVSAALVLRALAAGCPLLWVAPTGPAAGAARWLSDLGCARIAAGRSGAIAAALEALLERESDVDAMVERGRALAARHDRHGIVERLHGVLDARPSGRRAA